ncbi:MAG: pentapeptide repeat-containing protein [Bacteroidota bacterium]
MMRWCSYKMNDGESCIYPAFDNDKDDLCIFHSIDLTHKTEFHTHLFKILDAVENDINKKEIDCSGYVFPEIDFSSREFKKSVIFKGAHFNNGVSFKGCKFFGPETDFSGCIFEGDTIDFSSTEFNCKRIIFAKCNFNANNVQFERAVLNAKEIVFAGSTWNNDYTRFHGSKFIATNGTIDFNGAKFIKGNIYWFTTVFEGKRLTFNKTLFEVNFLSFKHTDFRSNDTIFEGATFNSKETIFKYTYFGGITASFERVQFVGQKTSFYHVMFNEAWYSFDRSLFRGKVIIEGDGFSERSCPLCSMINIQIDEPNNLTFRHIDLSRTEFRGTDDLRKIEFIDVGWYKIPNTFLFFKKFYRSGLFDEVSLSTPDIYLISFAANLELIRRAYRQLKQNYDDNKNYSEAGDFYYGEMEMQRRKLGWRKYIFSWEWWYWVISGYGQRWENSFGWMIFLFFGLPLLFIKTGLDFIYKNVHYPAGYWHAFQFNFLTITFQKDIGLLYDPSVLTRNIAIVESLVMPVLGTLFVLALRRRFKR